MAVEQLLLLRLSNTNRTSAEDFVEIPLGKRLLHYGMSKLILGTHIERLLSLQENCGHFRL